jgi:hypothetical protein
MGRWLACAVLACVLAGSAQAAPQVEYAFTVVAPRSVSPSGVVARAILEVAGARCPVVRARTETGRALRLRMTRLAAPDGSLGFDGITVCRRPLPRGLERASVGGQRLPLPVAGTPQRIALFGDTGCRIDVEAPTPPATEPSYLIQDCNSPAAWPLETIAREIAAAQPDVILHTGDYFYRESDCPASDPYAPLCAGSPPVNPPGSPNEDTYAGWEADWLRPARALFPVAPLVLARGNHETCTRAGTGYFFLLDPGVSPPDTCQRAYAQVYDPERPPPTVAQPTWIARLGRLDLAVLDSSSASDTAVENAATYSALGRRAVALLRRGPRATGWLLTHKPVYGWERFNGPDQPPVWTNLTLQAALDPLIEPFAAVLSGHLHLFQTVELPGRPGQLTLGDGGTLLDPADHGGALPTFGPTGLPAPTRGVTSFTFGWVLLRPGKATDVFTGRRYEAGAGAWATCRLARHSIDCRPL